jgi:hypothetical protein
MTGSASNCHQFLQDIELCIRTRSLLEFPRRYQFLSLLLHEYYICFTVHTLNRPNFAFRQQTVNRYRLCSPIRVRKPVCLLIVSCITDYVLLAESSGGFKDKSAQKPHVTDAGGGRNFPAVGTSSFAVARRGESLQHDLF